TIKANSGLSESEIQQMVKDAELNAEDDKKKVELVHARNAGEAMVHSVKKSLEEHGDKLDGGEKEAIEAALTAVEEAIKGDDKADIEAKTETLMSASQKLGEKVYAASQAEAAAAEGDNQQDSGASASASAADRRSTRLNSSHVKSSYAGFCV